MSQETTPVTKKFSRLGVTEFKAKVGASTLEVLKNPKNSKLFVSGSNGHVYRCQQAIDLNAPLEFLTEDGDWANACLVNKGSGAELLKVL